MSYKIEELSLQSDLPEEQKRTREIFDDLKAKCIAGEFLTEHEKDFFSTGIETSLRDDGKLGDYSCCKNYIFETTYLTYFQDLLGLSLYSKFERGKVRLIHPEESLRNISYLINEATNWLEIIQKTNHTNELLNQVTKETRGQLKAIEKSKGKLLFNAEKKRYLLDRRKTILQSKYMYLKVLKIFEMFDKSEFILQLNGQDIELNEYGLVHILSRHFSKITKAATNKTFHVEDFEPEYLNKQIGKIFEDIDKSGLLEGKPINKIAFNYKGIDYLIWIKEKTKSIKGQGAIRYNRLETFYPLEKESDLEELAINYTLETVTDELSVYVENE